MKSSSQYTFAQVPKAQIPRSSFRRTMGWKTTFDSGYLVPIYVDEALPGDTFNLKLSTFARLSTPVVPIMDNVYMDFFFFAVPLRLVWDNFQKFMGEQAKPTDSIDYLCPQVKPPTGTSYAVGSLEDYFGIPTGVNDLAVDAFWHRAYNLIWNEWFRDENLQESVDVPTGDGPDESSTYKLLRRGKRHDYFTSCLPFAQKGDPASIGLAGTAPVIGNGNAIGLESNRNTGFLSAPNQTSFSTLMFKDVSTVGDLSIETGRAKSTALTDTPNSLVSLSPYASESGIVADLSQATSVTINSLREAFAVQRALERLARGGSRYVELLRSCFGVVSPDARLQRPEYLGGGSTPISIHQVAQTSATSDTADTPQGNMAAYGISASSGIGFCKSFTEHSVVIGLACVRADLSYQQGLHRMWSRRNRFDFYWPMFAHLGEQAVLNKEIFAQGNSDDDKVFGYQERWAEYRYGQSRITGKFRSTYAQSLDVWHLAQHFETLPTLNSDFIEEHPPLDRVLAVQDEPQIIYDSLISLNCVRPMPTFSVPGLVDHF